MSETADTLRPEGEMAGPGAPTSSGEQQPARGCCDISYIVTGELSYRHA